MRVAARHFAAAAGRVRPSSLRSLAPEVPTTCWADVGGLPAVKRHLRELIELPLKRPELLAKFGMSPPRGALLYGPPGQTAIPSVHGPGEVARCSCRKADVLALCRRACSAY